jgi:hypothetical protein
MNSPGDLITHCGGCHCQRVRFEGQAPSQLVVYDCNCSICKMVAYQHLIVRAEAFRLLTGSESLGSYRFNTGAAQHLFCAVCGIKSYYAPRSHPDGISVNARCLDAGTVGQLTVLPFDGQHWEASQQQVFTPR